jgi:hypothetical protein
LKSIEIHTITEVTALPPHLIGNRKLSSWLTKLNLEIGMKVRRTGKESHPSRVLFIGPSKTLKD